MLALKKKNMSPIQTNNRTECVVYARVVGWLTPIKCYNKGKAAEYADRKTYKIKAEKISE
jgi:hypothetical protein